jgi:hypothetical protein
MKYQITQSSQTEPSEGQLGRNKNYREKTSTINPMGIQPLYIKKKKKKKHPKKRYSARKVVQKKKKDFPELTPRLSSCKPIVCLK